MSASDKKKLRKEQDALQMTQKQRQEQSEAKKLKVYSITFIVVLALVAATALGILAANGINRTGFFQKNTVAVTLGDHKLNNVQLNYYFVDAVQSQYQEWYQSYGEYTASLLQMYGLGAGKPLNQATYNSENNTTWADYFTELAISGARADYAIYDLAKAAGYQLSDAELDRLDANLKDQEMVAPLYGHKSLDTMLEYTYGMGSNVKSYREYLEVSELAKSFYENKLNSLEYDNAAIRAYEADRYNDYNSFSFLQVYFPYKDFLTGGTTDEDGHTTYTDAENEAARKAAKAAAETLLSCTTSEEIDAAIEKLEQYDKDKIDSLKTQSTDKFYGNLAEAIKEWVADKDRKEGDIAVLENATKTTDADDKEITTVNGYYVILFGSKNENKTPMGNVRHLLVSFEGGTKDENNKTVYSDEEKKTAKDEAEKLLKQWKDGAATEETFIELVKEHSDDTSASSGGLFEDINAGSNYVPNFKNWALDSERKKGDVEIVETEYGYHIMYYVETSELNYRDFMISGNLRNDDMEKWYKEAVDKLPVVKGKTSYLRTDMTMG